MQIGDLLSIDDGSVECTNCEQSLGNATANIKENLPVRERPVTAAGPTFVDTSRFVNEEMVFREFFCPGCGSLLFTETAQKGDPVLQEFEIK